VSDRTQKLLFAVALVFALGMGGLYLSMLRGPTTPEAPPPTPVAVIAPTPAPRPPPRRQPPRRSAPAQDSAWEEEPVLEADQVLVTGHVFDERGRPAPRVQVIYFADGRRKRTKADDTGAFEFKAKASAIQVWAERKDGSLIARSSRIDVDGAGGGEWEVDLLLESTRRAGLGIRVSKHQDGLYIRSVIPGSSAEELGLVRGDLIIEVDGESMEGLAVSTITAKLTGPEGTKQNFVVRHLDGSSESMEFERRPVVVEKK
jgi:hypothetical protein